MIHDEPANGTLRICPSCVGAYRHLQRFDGFTWGYYAGPVVTMTPGPLAWARVGLYENVHLDSDLHLPEDAYEADWIARWPPRQPVPPWWRRVLAFLWLRF